VIDDEGVRGVICVPLVSDPLLSEGAIFGVLYACSRQPRSFTHEECDLLAALGRDAGVVLARVYRQAELEQARDDLALRNKTLQRHLGFLGDVADAFAATGDLAAGLHAMSAYGVGVNVFDQAGGVLAKAGEESGEEHASVPLQAGGIELGRLDFVRADPFTPDDFQLAEHTGRLVALQLLRERSTLEAEMRLHGQLLDDLLEGSVADASGIIRRGSLLGVDLRAPGLVVCIGVHPQAAEHGKAPTINRAAADLLERLARQQFEQALVALRGDQVVLLAGIGGRDHATAHSMMRRLLAMASEFMGGKPLAAGVGRLCLSLGDYAHSFSEACTALELAMSRPDPGHVLTPADLGLLAVLGRGQQKQPLQELVKTALEPIVTSDRDGGSDYVKTLATYLSADRHLERAAAQLHVHVNTLRYRLGKIQELLGVDLHDVDARFLLELALRVHAVLDVA
jgi:DNA-binding PucR family transcriptional regulator